MNWSSLAALSVPCAPLAYCTVACDQGIHVNECNVVQGEHKIQSSDGPLQLQLAMVSNSITNQHCVLTQVYTVCNLHGPSFLQAAAWLFVGAKNVGDLAKCMGT